MTSKLDNLFDYVQERCLWQFASRTCDRTENIEGVLKLVVACRFPPRFDPGFPLRTDPG